MSYKERVIHSVLFEFMLVVMFTFVLKFITSSGTTTAFSLAITITLVAVVWNFIYNLIFDKYVTGPRENRTLKIWSIHAILFELGLLFPTLPIIAYSLEMGYVKAFVLDIGFIAFVLVFTIIYNYVYDRVRLLFLK